MGIQLVLLGTKARYAVMAMVELARRDLSVPVALADLSESQEIALPYLEQIFSRLKQAAIVNSVRGPGGGYVLSRPAAEISIADIVRASEENLKMTRCNSQSGGCMSTKAKCLTHDLWEGLEMQINSYLQNITLADIVSQRSAIGNLVSGIRDQGSEVRDQGSGIRDQRAKIYLDYNSTAPVRPEVIALMAEIMEFPANSSSAHGFGRKAHKILEDSRKLIAESISAFPNELIFMSCASEANATALRGFPERRLLVSAVEHSSVLHNHDSAADVQHIPVDSHGVVDLAALDELLAEGGKALVSVMLANNETGIIQPMRSIADICKKHNALLHSDAVQALGKVALDFTALGVDMMSIAAHKMGGAVGAAALVIRQDLPIKPLLYGGGQELRRRAGTENIAAIAGFAKAVEMIDLAHMQKLRLWLDEMENKLAAAGAYILPTAKTENNKHTNTPPPLPRLPTTPTIAIPRLPQEVLLMKLDLAGFAVSAGSACSSGRIEPSHVLAAMKTKNEIAKSAIRISAGWATKEKEIQAISQELSEISKNT